jgi:hypothetical protein
MSRLTISRILSAIVLLAGAVTNSQAQKPTTPPDSTLYTNYFGSPTSVDWIVCGSTEESEGCYDSGTLGPFVGVGAMLESAPSISGNVVTRGIYIVDSGDASAVTLYVYKKVDTISSSFDTTTVTLAKTVSLPLTGGSGVVTSMGANSKFLYIGTDQSPQAVRVSKSNFAVITISGFSPPINVTSITADQYGYVTVTQAGAFTLYGPNGEFEEDGGGTQFMLGTTQALPASLLLNGDPLDGGPRRGYKLKTTPPSGN